MTRAKAPVKVGIIRCQQTEALCPGTADFKCAACGQGVFEGLGQVEIIGFVSCGGCPGKQAVARAKMLAERGAEIVIFASCMKKGTPIGFPCPHFARIFDSARKALPVSVKLLDWTH